MVSIILYVVGGILFCGVVGYLEAAAVSILPAAITAGDYGMLWSPKLFTVYDREGAEF